MTKPSKYDVFISYSAKDRPWASEFVDALKSEGVNAWYDQDIEPGDRWSDKTEEALREAAVMVVLWTPDYLNSTSASFEIGAAVGDNKKIIPVLREPLERDQLSPLLQRWASLEESSPRVAGKRVAESLNKWRIHRDTPSGRTS
jgi:hypothetical protein